MTEFLIPFEQRAAALLDLVFPNATREVVEARGRGWVKKYLDNRYGYVEDEPFYVPTPITPRRSSAAGDWRIRQQVERRRFVATLPTTPRKFRLDDGADLLPCVVSGRAAPLGRATQDARRFEFTATALQGAAARIQDGRQPCFLAWEHDESVKLADVESGSLDVFFQRCEVAGFDGLGFRARLANTPMGRQAVRILAAGRYGVSMGFEDPGPNWTWGGTDLKTSTDVFELSLVKSPAFGRGAWVQLNWLVPEKSTWPILFGSD